MHQHLLEMKASWISHIGLSDTLCLQIGMEPANIVGLYTCPYNNIAKPQL